MKGRLVQLHLRLFFHKLTEKSDKFGSKFSYKIKQSSRHNCIHNSSYIYMCVCVCVYIYIYIYTLTHTHTHQCSFTNKERYVIQLDLKVLFRNRESNRFRCIQNSTVGTNITTSQSEKYPIGIHPKFSFHKYTNCPIQFDLYIGF